MVLEHDGRDSTVVVSNLVLCSLAAYAFARIRFLGHGFVYFVMLATLMVPLQVVLIPTFLIVKDLGLLDRLGALVVPNLVNVFGIFLLTQFFRTCRSTSRRRRGSTARRACRSWCGSWSRCRYRRSRRWRDPVPVDVERLPVAARDPDEQDAFTLQLGLAPSRAPTTAVAPRLPRNIMSMIPMIVFLLAQRYFVRGIATQGLKG